MNWILASLLMLLCSVVMYLFVRKGNQQKIPNQLSNLAMFLIPVLMYLVLATQTGTNFSLTFGEHLLLIVSAVLFSYLGTVFSLEALAFAPNPGYSLIISKSYVVFTSIASIFLFNSTLTLKSALAIVAIIFFSSLIVISKNQSQKHSASKWLPYTFGSFFCWGLLSLSAKYLLNLGVPILVRLIYTMSIVTVLLWVDVVRKKIDISKITQPQLWSLLGMGIFGAGFNYFTQLALTTAPNIGYVNTVSAASISLLTVFSAVIFKDELTVRKWIGVVGVTGGLVALLV